MQQVKYNLFTIQDTDIKAHNYRVGKLSYKLARTLDIDHVKAVDIMTAGLHHDVGKIFIPNKILNKPGQLTVDEFEYIKQHSIYSYILLIGEGFKCEVCEIVKHHHENFNGTGYPDRLKKDEIPLGSRILRVADMFDALIHDRIYRKGIGIKEALKVMEKEKEFFDPLIFIEFKKLVAELYKISQ